MADTSVTPSGTTDDAADETAGVWGPYWMNTSNAVIIYAEDGEDIAFSRTTDGGVSWTETVIETSRVKQIAAWFDKETPNDSGTLVHVMWMDDTGDDVHYQTVDVDDGSLGTLRTIDGTASVAASNNANRCSITKARNGNLIAAFSNSTKVECLRSTDSGVNWTDRADVFETGTEADHLLLFPANVDDGDVAALFWDRSADELSVKIYDDSANTWTETSILTSMIDSGTWINMDGSVRHSDGLILACAHSDFETGGNDLRTFTVNPDSIASPTIDTTTANVFTDQAEQAQCGLLINQQNNDVYIAWLKGGGFGSLMDCVYKISTDNMSSWGSEQAYSEAAQDDLRRVHSGRSVGDDGGFFQPCFYNDDTFKLAVNLVNDVAISSSTNVLSITETETVNITESIAVLLPLLTAMIDETVTVTESTELGRLGISITDTINVSEDVVVNPLEIRISETETFTVIESISITPTVEPAIFPPVLFRRAKTYKRL